MLSSRENWERLVAAVLKREQFFELCFQHSRTPSISTVSSDSTSDFSGQILNFSSNSLEHISASPPANKPISEVSSNTSGPIMRKLFSTWYGKRKPKDEYLARIPEDLRIHSGRVRRFSLHELRVATQNFSKQNLFKYGYNKVYKGWLPDGTPVAVKIHKNRHAHGAEVQFQNQVEINRIAEHPNVLHVLGQCITPKEWLLVYPLMVNGSVASCLRGRHKSHHPLNWPIRKRIALGAARGLAYLHHECDKKIIHRDIKATNILLDEDFEAVVVDFELAIIVDCNVAHVNTSIVGTIGHMAPEYLSLGICSEKTDVFGYGIFLLELITGQRAFDLVRLANEEDVMLLDWMKRNFKEGKWEMMVDPDCEGDHMGEVVQQLMQIALLCTNSNPAIRPKMSRVVRMLETQKWHS